MSKYTRSGDDGLTSLGEDNRVKKSSDIIELHGCLESMNVSLGYAAESLCYDQNFRLLLKQVYRIQCEVFDLSQKLASSDKFAINPHKTTQLESEIDAMTGVLPVSEAFILPGGGECALRIYMARTECRRAERIAFKIAENKKSNADVFAIYLNRLGEWLYTAARTASMIANIEETVVDPKLV